MLIVRGVNVFPSAIENVVRRFQEVGEFVIEVVRDHEMDELEIRVEAASGDAERLIRAIEQGVHVDIGFRPRVSVAAEGTLPRFELKARRVFDRRSGATAPPPP